MDIQRSSVNCWENAECEYTKDNICKVWMVIKKTNKKVFREEAEHF